MKTKLKFLLSALPLVVLSGCKDISELNRGSPAPTARQIYYPTAGEWVSCVNEGIRISSTRTTLTTLPGRDTFVSFFEIGKTLYR